MGRDREKMEKNAEPFVLNLGCGFRKFIGVVNVDAYDICSPDVVWDLNITPWPWNDGTVDKIIAWHIFEHLPNWIEAFRESARVLKVGGILDVRVPDSTDVSAICYRDHHQVFHRLTFTEILAPELRGANAEIQAQKRVPFKMNLYTRLPYERYVKWWFPKWLLWWCSIHMLNFIYEQEFVFEKIKLDREV